MPVKSQTKRTAKSKKRARKNGKSRNTSNSGAKLLVVPQARGFATTSVQPRISQSTDSIRIKHREYWYTTVGGLSATYTVWKPNGRLPRINPANDYVFPWLSNIAQCYERYTFHKLTFGYMPRCSTSTTGTVMMAVDPDPLDNEPATEAVFLSYKSCVDGPCWAELKCVMSEQDLHGSYKKKYVTRTPDLDPRGSDCGSFLYYGDGPASTGKFYVEYDVSLYTPQLPPTGVAGAGVVADVSPTMTELFGIAPSIASTGINLVKDVATNKFQWSGVNVGDILNVVWTFVNNSASTAATIGTGWGISGLTQLQSSGSLTLAPGASGSMTKQYQVLASNGALEVPVPVGMTQPPTHSNLLFTTVPFPSSGNIW